MRVTSSFCVTPKRNHPDQEPTPIGCLIFKELANQPLGFFAALQQQRRAHYTEVLYCVNVFLKFLKTSSKTTDEQQPLDSSTFSPLIQQRRCALYRRFLLRQPFLKVSQKVFLKPPAKKHNPLILFVFSSLLKQRKMRIIQPHSGASILLRNKFETLSQYLLKRLISIDQRISTRANFRLPTCKMMGSGPARSRFLSSILTPSIFTPP